MPDKNDEGSKKFKCDVVNNVTHPLRLYEFTPEEIRVLEECDRDSFYFRCLPFSTGLAAATYAAVRTGFVKRSPHWGVVPKVVTMALLGHVLGRIAYIPQCAEKLRTKLPKNSHLGNVMREHDKQSKDTPKQKAK